MDTPSTDLPRRWRGEGPVVLAVPAVKVQPRRSLITLVLATMAALLVCITGLLSWWRPVPGVHFLPLVVTSYQHRAIPTPPMGKKDLEGLCSGGYFRQIDNLTKTCQSGQLIMEELANLKACRSNETVVVFLSANALFAGAGKIHILPADANPDDTNTWISLQSILETLRSCPARNQLLVLDIFRPLPGNRLGGLYQDVAAKVADELAAVSDERRLVLTACAPGQVAWSSEELGRSVFAYYLEEGLRGYAKVATAAPDNQVTVRELAQFVRARVHRWALHNRAQAQTPVLYGSAEDFSLVALEHGKPRAHVALAGKRDYPVELSAAWQLRDSWWADATYRLAPRAFQAVQAALLEAEREWGSGVEEAQLRQGRLRAVPAAQASFARERGLFQPHAVSLAQEEIGGERSPTQQRLHTLIENSHKQLFDARIEDAEKLKAVLSAEFHDKTKEQRDYDREKALFEAALTDVKHEPGTLRFLDDLGRPEQREPRYVETLLLRQLADLAFRIEERDWPGPLVGQLLRVARLGETASADAITFPWTAPLLGQARQLRHDAEIYLWARGYAPLTDVEKKLKSAEQLYQAALADAGRLRQAQATLDEALSLLPFYLPYVEADPTQQTHWHEAAATARDLAEALIAPSWKKTSQADVPPPLQEKLHHLEQLSRQLAQSLEQLKKPFEPADLRQHEIVIRAKGADGMTLVRLEALLRVPASNLTADRRAGLWALARQLARQLNDETVHLDHEEDSQGQLTPTPVLTDKFGADENSRARQRAQIALDLFELGGVTTGSLQPMRTLLAGLNDKSTTAEWCDMDKLIRRTWGEQLTLQYQQLKPAQRQVRLSWIAPPLETIRAIDESELSASTLVRLKQARDHWAWLGDHYRYQARDYRQLGLTGAGPQSASAFYARAATANDDLANLEPEVYASIHSKEPIARLMSSQSRVSAMLEVQRALPPGTSGPLEVRLKLPDTAWLQVSPNSVRLPGGSDASEARQFISTVPIVIGQSLDAERSFIPRPLGFLAEAHMQGRNFHALIPVPLHTQPKEVELFVSASPLQAEPGLAAVLLRPNKQRATYYVHLKNLTPRTREVVVDVLVGGKSKQKVQTTLNPEQTKRVDFGEAVIPADSLPEVTGPLVVRATDGETTNLLDQKVLRLEIATPATYVRVREVRFDPADERGKNKLTVKLQANSPPYGPTIPAELVLGAPGIPGYLGIESGTLQTDLSVSAEAPATLFAENIRLRDSAGAEGLVFLQVDGLERAFRFRTKFTRGGPSSLAQADRQPAVRWNVPAFVPAGAKTSFPIEVDDAPPGARLEVKMEHGSADQFEPDQVIHYPLAKQQRIGFWSQGKQGALVFEAEVNDWPLTWNTSRVVGPRMLHARLVDSQGSELATSSQLVTIDNDPPNLARLVDVPAKIKRGSPLQVRAQGQDLESGITRAVFFFGQPSGDMIPPQTPIIIGSPVDASRMNWVANVQFPEDKRGPTPLTVQFTNGVGLVRYHTATVELTDIDPTPPPRGSLRGTIYEGPRTQPGLEVILRDGQGVEKLRTRTQNDGSFLFQDLPPGNYVIFCVKPDSLRRATLPILVEPNKTTVRKVELAL